MCSDLLTRMLKVGVLNTATEIAASASVYSGCDLYTMKPTQLITYRIRDGDWKYYTMLSIMPFLIVRSLAGVDYVIPAANNQRGHFNEPATGQNV